MIYRKAFRIETTVPVFVGKKIDVKIFVISSMGGYFPVLGRDSYGTLVAVLRYGDIHVGQAGALGFALSKDDVRA